jgi:glycosyltransferase involved in cell wall biosynthesis
MKISVIMPCYNAEKYILQALRSIQGQSFVPYEIIIIDDSSSDGSLDVIKSSGINVKLIHTQHLGGAGARNAGIFAAKGDWLAFLDADDIWYPMHLLRAVNFIQEHNIVGYINHFDYLSIEESNPIKRFCPVHSVSVGFGLAEYITLYIQYKSFVGMSSCLIKRERAMAVGGFDKEQISRHDIEFWLRVVNNQWWLFDPVPSSAYRKNNPGSITSNKVIANRYRLIAFLKQKDNIRNSPAFDRLLRYLAGKVLSSSFQFGTAEDQVEAYKIAFKYLNKKEKTIYGIIRVFPCLFRIFKKVKWI